jgi:hypothetical protein
MERTGKYVSSFPRVGPPGYLYRKTSHVNQCRPSLACRGEQ